MIIKNRILSAFLASITLLTFQAFASNDTATYSGNTGILETPNGRIMPDWSMRTFINQDKPYTYYGFTATPLPFLESNFHMTQMDGTSNLIGFGENSTYGDYKDKSFSFKLLLKKFTKILISVC